MLQIPDYICNTLATQEEFAFCSCFLLKFCFVFWDRFISKSLCSPSWPPTPYSLPTLASYLLGLQMWATLPGLKRLTVIKNMFPRTNMNTTFLWWWLPLFPLSYSCSACRLCLWLSRPITVIAKWLALFLRPSSELQLILLIRNTTLLVL